MLPTFLGLGPSRCASTWLHHVLRQHPQIAMTRIKEVSFFGRYCLNQTLADYDAQFDRASKPSACIRGDISPWYARLSRSSISAVHHIVPRAQLILILRNPIDRAWSHAIMEVCDLAHRSLHATTLGAFLRRLERTRHIIDSDYERIIDRWLSTFDPSALHFDLYDNLCRSPRDVLSRILDHIGVDAAWTPPDAELTRRYWSSSEATSGQSEQFPMPPIVRWYLALQWRDSITRLNQRLDGKLDAWVSEINEIAGTHVPLTWSMHRLINRSILIWPERLLYSLYDGIREYRLSLAYERIIEENRNKRMRLNAPIPASQGRDSYPAPTQNTLSTSRTMNSR